MAETALAADGWEQVHTTVFSAAIGPTWMRGRPGAREVALPTDKRVANDHMGMVHGGALMTFADIALGIAVVDEIGGAHCATAQLQYQFAGGAKIGSLVTCEPEVVRRTSTMVFTRGLFKADGKVIGSADAIFKVFPTPAG
ncbi:PaaI family thioesterase [Novosphingobium album (ex Liu et al. 2023)]|uniref:PaaI family thioesterase n=1 Tax=Novosphingobium album (ex Liu et al. 2023) TaxID=3031130 RepID=A0ABT5WUF6_9SPHN|nr:PaaI family thioesterase [Novosphingobium album (ex Liu et al. 2023)]MDE8653507.1 PaaI family thioesterase [Novosphingobium album (ex Liu et al. 2023)]